MNILLITLLVFVLTPIVLPIVTVWSVFIIAIFDQSKKIAEDKFYNKKE